MKRPVTLEEHRAAGNIVTRYVVTHVNHHGMRTLTLACQGRHTYATRAEAEEWLGSFLANNSLERLAEVYGAQALGTFAVRPCECWAGHFDPCGIYFD